MNLGDDIGAARRTVRRVTGAEVKTDLDAGLERCCACARRQRRIGPCNGGGANDGVWICISVEQGVAGLQTSDIHLAEKTELARGGIDADELVVTERVVDRLGQLGCQFRTRQRLTAEFVRQRNVDGVRVVDGNFE